MNIQEIEYRNVYIEQIIDYLVDNKIKPPNLYEIPHSEFNVLKEESIKWQTTNTQRV